MKVFPAEAHWTVPLATAESSTPRESDMHIHKSAGVSTTASKFFYVDASGAIVDTSLREGAGWPRFTSSDLEKSYLHKRLKHWKESRGLAVRAALLACLAAFGGIDAVTVTGAVSAFSAVRLAASILVICISPVFFQKRWGSAHLLQWLHAGVAVLVVSNGFASLAACTRAVHTQNACLRRQRHFLVIQRIHFFLKHCLLWSSFMRAQMNGFQLSYLGLVW